MNSTFIIICKNNNPKDMRANVKLAVTCNAMTNKEGNIISVTIVQIIALLSLHVNIK